MSMYQLIIVLSLAAVLHAQCMELDIQHSENYTFNPVNANAARAWVCERYGISIPADIEGIEPQIQDAKYCCKVGAGNQELSSWFDLFSPINQIRTKFCGKFDLRCYAETLASKSALLTTAFLSTITNIVISGISITSLGFSSVVSKTPPNVALLFSMFNGKNSFIEDLYREGLINKKMWTIDLQSTGLTPGKVILGTWNLGDNYIEVPVIGDSPCSLEVKYMSLDGYFFTFTPSAIIFDLLYDYVSISDKNMFEMFMDKISAVKGADGNYHLDCATASKFKNLDFTMGYNNLYRIKMEKLFKKSGNDCICLVQHTPGINAFGLPALEGRCTSYDFSNRTIKYTNPV